MGQRARRVKGKKHKKGSPVVSHVVNLPIPCNILKHYSNFEVRADMIFINRIPFFVSISRFISFTTVKILPNLSNKMLFYICRRVVRVYLNHGFSLNMFLLNGQFDSIKLKLQKYCSTVNIVTKKEHITEVEQFIRTLEEYSRAVRSTLPFTYLPRLITQYLVYFSNMWLNCFPKKGSVCNDISPREIMAGTMLNVKQHCKFQFGSYGQIFKNNEPFNDMTERTIRAI